MLLPLHTLQRRVTGSRRVSSLQVSMEAGADSASLKASLRQLMRERRKLDAADDDNFNIFDTQQLAETLSGTTQVLTTLLGAVAAVSLLVGGIGIMNIMLVSVTERTREIGLRLAVPYVFDPVINAVALVFSAAIGMVFGYFPARRAAQMDPIEALRHE